MLIDPTPPSEKNFKSHSKITKKYGVKAAGLAFLPPAWRLDFTALSIEVHKSWRNRADLGSNSEIKKLRSWLELRSFEAVILRSSGSSETLQDRGKFRSRILKSGWNFLNLINELGKLYEDASTVDGEADLGIVVQKYVKADYAGHLSNEHRVSPTINQWSYELELPQWAPSKGINSKFTTSPDPTIPLKCGSQIPHQPLRSVGHFLVGEFAERCHLEWLVHESTLFLMQIDFEWPQLDIGLDPKKDLKLKAPADLNLEAANDIRPYTIGSRTKWPKLKNLSDFDFEDDGIQPPRIYPLEPMRVVSAIRNKKELDKLVTEMKALTGNRLVVRTDCIKDNTGKFNLPRTDTIGAEDAIRWCSRTISQFEKQGVEREKFIFLFHAFLPAKASAWAYAKPGNPVVIVDALWGLPDGMQVLSVDTYEVNVTQNKVVQTKTTFKPSFLIEVDGGKWDYRSIKSLSGRGQVLTKGDKIEIATRTSKIAKKLNEDAQIMWFCDIPLDYKVGRNLPWFRSREILDPSPRQDVQYKPFRVSNPSDLQKVPTEKVTLQLSPEADLIRDNTFLESVIFVAKERSLPVQLEGSILGHAYYRLNQENIPVVLKNAPKYYRKRNAQVFGKLVRDKIPANIAEGGETVREAKLAKGDMQVGLAGKLLEELDEFLRAHTDDDIAAELADILEVVKGLAHCSGHSWSKIVRLAKEKALKRGGFNEGKVLVETALPHRDSPIERQEHVRLFDLGRVESKDNTVEIPPSTLVSTSKGPGVIFSFQGDPSRYRASIKEGKLVLTRLDTKVVEVDEKQQELF
ncbi:Predicted house-cleaning noncanonical NTP pyrophosphatase, all-alpha NTP-PPase (MazG) superfamily [Roseovarius azorensis]|uniref:Predicted house-cleaning noncanonical NTP pyrophosphatase, all-alpha NTP-PPase (MazG) superfamily n=1 Tax=Roseovarius azorensis TaxID=1287727 RepID=A0A1H7G7Q5_9RHOB|nr:nucleoside triphosphate pyrophosphohydrolase [Roseovarius azorensis]SEK32832.1 Predicted house-cleaning noncanonical NTP pyrophosphatase, all-alpha NTP-PPase (MazG) superfamily [Roseovarius azorensis]